MLIINNILKTKSTELAKIDHLKAQTKIEFKNIQNYLKLFQPSIDYRRNLKAEISDLFDMQSGDL